NPAHVQGGPEGRAEPEPAERPEPDPQPKPAVDPLAAEKHRYQAWTNYAANVARSSERELLLAAQIRAIDNHAMAHTEMRDQRVFDEVYTKNPERLQQWQEVRRERDALAREYQQEVLNRQSREREVATRRAVQHKAAADQWQSNERKKFHEYLSNKEPQFAKGTKAFDAVNTITGEIVQENPELKRPYYSAAEMKVMFESAKLR